MVYWCVRKLTTLVLPSADGVRDQFVQNIHLTKKVDGKLTRSKKDGLIDGTNDRTTTSHTSTGTKMVAYTILFTAIEGRSAIRCTNILANKV